MTLMSWTGNHGKFTRTDCEWEEKYLTLHVDDLFAIYQQFIAIREGWADEITYELIL